MKQLFLRLFMVLCVSIALVGCKDDDPTTDPNTNPDEQVDPDGTTPSAKFTLGEVGQSSVKVELESTSVVGYAYQVTENLTEAAPDAAILFAEGVTGEVTEDKTTIEVGGLDGATEYKIFISAKYADDKGYGEVVELDNFTTVGFDEFFTLLPSEPGMVKFHIEVPENSMAMYALIDLDNYKSFIVNYGWIDADFLKGAEPQINLIHESQTIEFRGWTDTDSATGEVTIYDYVHPGQALRLLAAEAEMGEVDYYGRQTYHAMYDFEGYIVGNMTGVVDAEDFWKNENHVSISTNVVPPTVVDAPVECSISHSTTTTVEFELTPSEQVNMYSCSYFDTATWNQAVSDYNYDGAIYLATTYGAVFTEAATFVAEDLQVGKTYQLIIIGRVNETGDQHSVKIVEFAPTPATKSAPSIKVSAITAPEGEVESPFYVWFNIKSDTKDVEYIKYMCDYVREWTYELNMGSSYAELMEYNGNIESSAEVIDGINSDAGYNICFSSTEETATRLVVVGVNDENTSSDADDENARADNTTIPIPDAPRVESTLFEDLVGEWTATATLFEATYDSSGNTVYVEGEDPVTSPVTISACPAYPDACPEEAYAAYSDMTREEVDALYEEFKASAVRYAEKTRGQNRLVCQGLNFANYHTTEYMSPVDLFYSPYYTAAITTDDIYFDYGPKWNLQINEGDRVTLPIDLQSIAPFSALGYDPLYQFATDMVNGGYDPEAKEFNVTISDDKNTITVEPMEGDNGGMLYYTVGSVMYGSMTPTFICSTFVLTRNEAGAAPVYSPAQGGNNLPKFPSDINITAPSSRTRMMAAPKSVKPTTRVVGSMVDMEVVKSEKAKSFAQQNGIEL